MTLLRMTRPTVAVLRVLLHASQNDPTWGFRICNDTDLGSGTTYPILKRLSDRGWLAFRDEESAHPGRPLRRHCFLTDYGRAQAERLLSERRGNRRAGTIPSLERV